LEQKRQKALRNVAIFAALLLLCLAGPAAVRHFTGDLFDEFKAPIGAIPSHLYDLEKYWSIHANSKRMLIEAGRDLARLNAAYELKLQENAGLKSQINRYERMMGFPSYEKYMTLVARVTERDLSAWWQRITVRRGSLDGVKEGCAVVFSGGVVGRVREVNLYTSVIELASSRNFRLAAHFENDESPVIYQGAGAITFHDPCGQVSDVASTLYPTASAPLKLVTSSLAGTFPDGIYIGEVRELKPDASAIFKEGRVFLNGALSTLREVAILIPIEPGAPIPEGAQ